MKRLSSLTLLGLILLTSCKKDKTPFPLEPAYNDLEHGWMDEPTESDFVNPQTVTPFFTNYKYQYRVPQFNPSNPDEIVYYYENSEANLQQLVKYNLKTTQKTILTNGLRIIEEPSWSSQGWIAFAHYPSYQIYLVKDDGTGLMQFTENSANLYPAWVSDGSCLTYSYEPVLGNLRNLLKQSINLSLSDTIIHMNDPNYNHVSRDRKISRNNQMLVKMSFNNSGYYASHNLNNPNLNLHPIVDFMTIDDYNAMFYCWSHSSEYFFLSYYSTGKIYKVRVSDGTYELFRPQYYANWIQTIDASPDGKYLVAERVDMFNGF